MSDARESKDKADKHSTTNMLEPQPGWVYAICQQGNLANVKIGFTTDPVVERFAQSNYARTLAPLQILRAFPCASARVAEGVVHQVLARFCNDVKHEVFDMTGNMDLFDDGEGGGREHRPVVAAARARRPPRVVRLLEGRA